MAVIRGAEFLRVPHPEGLWWKGRKPWLQTGDLDAGGAGARAMTSTDALGSREKRTPSNSQNGHMVVSCGAVLPCCRVTVPRTRESGEWPACREASGGVARRHLRRGGCLRYFRLRHQPMLQVMAVLAAILLVERVGPLCHGFTGGRRLGDVGRGSLLLGIESRLPMGSSVRRHVRVYDRSPVCSMGCSPQRPPG